MERRRGRPRLKDARRQYIVLRANDEERRKLDALAQSMGATTSAVLRQLINETKFDTGAGLTRQDAARAGATHKTA